MKTKILLMLAFMTFNVVMLIAQPRVEVIERTFDFGTIKEVDGVKTGKFIIKNIGNEPLRITNVRPSCGCTASKYTTEDIAPGASGFIEAAYDPTNRPGGFNKSIAVNTNDPQHETFVIYIKGDVIKRPPSKVDNYPTKLGNLRLTTNHYAFNEIKNTQKRTDTLRIFNETTQTILLNGTSEVPSFLKVEIPVKDLNPDDEGFIIITYDATKRDDFGFLFDKFNLLTNDNIMPEKLIYVSANVTADFSHLSEKQLARAPKIKVENEVVQFGEVKPGQNIEIKYVVKNEGRDPLQILKIKPSCGCTVAQSSKNSLKKDESTEIKFNFNTTGRNGVQHHNIVMYTNDPQRPVVVLYFQGTIVQ